MEIADKWKKDRYEKTKGNNLNGKSCSKFRGFLVSSAHGIVISSMLLSSFSWAWFSEKIEVSGTRIQSAVYGIAAEVSGNGTVTSGDDDNIVTGGDSILMEVEKGKIYEFYLRPADEATASKGGYCMVSAGDDMRYTKQIGPNGEVSFQILLKGNGTGWIEFLPRWGMSPEEIGDEDKILESGKYVVSDGDIMVSQGDNNQQASKETQKGAEEQ